MQLDLLICGVEGASNAICTYISPIKLCLGVPTFFGRELHSWAAMRLEIRVVTRGPRFRSYPGSPVPVVPRVPKRTKLPRG